MSEIIEIESPTVLGEMTRAESDIQIVTARRYPRDINTFAERALSLATINKKIAEDCYFRLPRGGKTIEGPSVRLAEIVASCWQNIKTASRIIEIGDTYVVSQGIAHDLENNALQSVEVRRKITDKKGKRFNEDMITMTCNAANSIALRNAIFKVVPSSLVAPILEKCKKIAIGNIKASLPERRAEMMKHALKMGITEEMVFTKLGVVKIDSITAEHLADLKGVFTAIRDGDTSIDTQFPPDKTQPKLIEPKTKKEEKPENLSVKTKVKTIEKIDMAGQIIYKIETAAGSFVTRDQEVFQKLDSAKISGAEITIEYKVDRALGNVIIN